MSTLHLALLVLSLSCSVSAIGIANSGGVMAGLALKGGDGHKGGACGFTQPFPAPTIYTAGVSPKIGGMNGTCGGCFELVCVNGKGNCVKGAKVKVTVTDRCAYGKGVNGGPCRRGAFSLQPEAFNKLSRNPNKGELQVRYKAVPCAYKGGVQFLVYVGNNYFLQVLIQNVGAAGTLKKVEVQAGDGAFIPMKWNYGSVWDSTKPFVITRRSLNFRLTSRDGTVLLVNKAIPAGFKPMLVYRTKTQYA